MDSAPFSKYPLRSMQRRKPFMQPRRELDMSSRNYTLSTRIRIFLEKALPRDQRAGAPALPLDATAEFDDGVEGALGNG